MALLQTVTCKDCKKTETCTAVQDILLPYQCINCQMIELGKKIKENHDDSNTKETNDSQENVSSLW